MKASRQDITRIGLSAASLLLGVVVIVKGLPLVTGVEWSQVLEKFAGLPVLTVVVLVVIWLLGLWAYTFLLAASLPGLANWQGFLLNSIGSSVSNLLPFGGAVGVAVTFAMTGRWGFGRREVLVSVLVSAIWNALGRLALPAVGLLVLLLAARAPNPQLATAGFAASGVLAASLAAVVGLLWRESVAVRLGRLVDAVARLVPSWWRPKHGHVGAMLVRLRRNTIDLVRQGWWKLTLAMLTYLALQAVLLAGCLYAVGAPTDFVTTVASFALSRALTTIVVTPGGFGISETGTAALMVALGVPPALAAAAILLFAMFTFVLEIPLGGLAWIAWTLADRRRPRRRVADPAPATSPETSPKTSAATPPADPPVDDPVDDDVPSRQSDGRPPD